MQTPWACSPIQQLQANSVREGLLTCFKPTGQDATKMLQFLLPKPLNAANNTYLYWAHFRLKNETVRQDRGSQQASVGGQSIGHLQHVLDQWDEPLVFKLQLWGFQVHIFLIPSIPHISGMLQRHILLSSFWNIFPQLRNFCSCWPPIAAEDLHSVLFQKAVQRFQALLEKEQNCEHVMWDMTSFY